MGSVPGFRNASLCAGPVAFLVSGRLPCAGDKVKGPSAARLEVGRAALGIRLGRCVESRLGIAAREFRGVPEGAHVPLPSLSSIQVVRTSPYTEVVIRRSFPTSPITRSGERLVGALRRVITRSGERRPRSV